MTKIIGFGRCFGKTTGNAAEQWKKWGEQFDKEDSK